MAKKMLLAAIGCGRLPGILEIAGRRSFVVFGAIGKDVAAALTQSVDGPAAPVPPVYFYETG
ncbi:hypothetical protein TRIP_B10022 [uncultured Desulfatiglans sp.]|uniref:Uncharacterized protein n=1 Tax=Uncultured Desulfatiglans sp. TaxID=1748965 RepID=A0A652ZZW3_UNCDX|nr:hypothetical protein TRIP_B10022 [uncultured Desulfatiglans sp.]